MTDPGKLSSKQFEKCMEDLKAQFQQPPSIVGNNNRILCAELYIIYRFPCILRNMES